MQLSPYLDKDEIVKVGGRIDETAIPNLGRRQTILPGKHYLVNLIKSFHMTHNEAEYILAELTQIYAIVNARKSINKVARQWFVYLP